VKLGLLACLVLIALGCDEQQPASKTPRRQALETLTSEVFVPMLQDTRDASAELRGAVGELCDAPGAERLEAAQAAWRAARGPWKQTDILTFGPHTLPPWRFASAIDFWPAREASIESALARFGGAAGEDDDAGVEPGDAGSDGLLASTEKGFPVLEYLLFVPRDEAALLAAFEGSSGAGRCAYLQRVSDELAQDTAELLRVYKDDYAPDFTLASGPNELYASVNAAFGDIVNNIGFTVEAARGMRMGKPLGASNGGVAQPELVESRFSDRSIDDVLDVLAGARATFLGEYKDHRAYGIDKVLEARGISLRDDFEAKYDAAVSAIRAIEPPLRVAVVEAPGEVEHAREALQELMLLLQVDVNQALAVTVTFGRTDGDGD
jgi:predicted lipoprotein